MVYLNALERGIIAISYCFFLPKVRLSLVWLKHTFGPLCFPPYQFWPPNKNNAILTP